MNNDYDDFYTPNEKNEDNDYDSADHDFGPPDFDMPENADMNNNATPHGEKVSNLDKDVSQYSKDHVSLKLAQCGTIELKLLTIFYFCSTIIVVHFLIVKLMKI